MSRTLSNPLIEAQNAQETGECAITLLEISHDDLATPIRVTQNGEQVTSNGEIYEACYFDVVLPNEKDGEQPKARLAIDNVDRRIVEAVRALSSPPSVTLRIVLASSPDTVEVEYDGLEFKDIDYDALMVQGTLGFENILGEPFPADTFNPAGFPGLFGTTEEVIA